jgi:hypothetical protein
MHCHEYSAITSRLRFPEQRQQALMPRGEMQPEGVPRPRDAEHMHPDQVMEPSARCGVLPRWALVMRPRGVLFLEGGAKTIRSSGRDQPAHRPHHQPRPEACRLLARARGGQQVRIFAEAQPAVGMPLACVAGQEPLGRSPDVSACRGRQDDATVRVDTCRTRGEP